MKTVLRIAARIAMSSPIGPVAFAQQAVPVRTLTKPALSDSGLFMTLSNLRPLSDGRVIVDDLFRRRILLFDSTLATWRILADTAQGAPTRYPNTYAAIVPYVGDSTFLVNSEAQTLEVIDPSGAFVRTMAIPRPADLRFLQIAPGSAATDPRGRLVYRVSRGRAAPRSPAASDSGAVTITVIRDSAAIVRADFDTRLVDTIATHAVPVQKSLTMATGNGGYAGTVAYNPLPQTDDWAMLPDGTIAIVRGQDYHIDWVRPDGTRSSSPKMPFDWKRITIEDKQRMLDSARQAAADRDARAAEARAAAAAGGSVGGRGAPPGGRGFVAPRFPFTTVDVTDMPDYYPPIRSGTVRSDPEGNVWILPTTSVLSDGGLIYDVVNRKGVVIERVKLPARRNLLAIGARGVVYMSYTPKGGLIQLERAQVIR